MEYRKSTLDLAFLLRIYDPFSAPIREYNYTPMTGLASLAGLYSCPQWEYV